MVKCPTCKAKGTDIVLHEIWQGAHMEFEQNSNGTINPAGEFLDNLDPKGVNGFCLQCRRVWKLRGVRQIVNVPGHPDFAKYKRQEPANG